MWSEAAAVLRLLLARLLIQSYVYQTTFEFRHTAAFWKRDKLEYLRLAAGSTACRTEGTRNEQRRAVGWLTAGGESVTARGYVNSM